jgi:hypothetical protein
MSLLWKAEIFLYTRSRDGKFELKRYCLLVDDEVPGSEGPGLSASKGISIDWMIARTRSRQSASGQKSLTRASEVSILPMRQHVLHQELRALASAETSVPTVSQIS